MANGNSSSATRIELLTRDNYDTWAMQVEALLVKNDLWEYVIGAVVKPDTDEVSARAWLKADSKARADLILAIHPSQLKQVRGCETASEIWTKLSSIYASKGLARKATLLKQLIMHKLDEGSDVKDHIAKFFDAMDKLENIGVKIDADLLSIMLLYSLPASYENFRCAIESRDQLPDAENLKVKIIEESDARRQSTVGTVIAMTAAPTKQVNVWRGTSKPLFKCFKCRGVGHKASECVKNKKVAKLSGRNNNKPNATETFYAAVANTSGDVGNCSA